MMRWSRTKGDAEVGREKVDVPGEGLSSTSTRQDLCVVFWPLLKHTLVFTLTLVVCHTPVCTGHIQP